MAGSGPQHEAATDNLAARKPRWAGVVIAVCFEMIVAGVVGWSLRTVLVTPAANDIDAGYTSVAVREGVVSRSLTLNTTATWRSAAVARNRAAGTVTSVSVRGAKRVNAGARIYSVNLRPVVIAVGSTPMFRDLTAGVEGPDVRQFEQLLVTKRFLSRADTQFTSSTAAAVKQWQHSLGVNPDGVVRSGDVVFVDSLPVRLGLGKAFSKGAELAGGEEILAYSEPTFTIRATAEQASKIANGSAVVMTSPRGKEWSARTSGQRVAEDGSVAIALSPLNSSRTICGSVCAEIGTTGETLLVSTIEVVKPTKGLVVPAAAVVTDASGQTLVILPSGARVPVTVVATAAGQSIVTGVDAGELVRAPAQ